MAASKWIRRKSPREKVHRVCARLLRDRLQTLAAQLPQSAARAPEDPEHVHQLRVGTRRADAALDLCKELLSRRHRRRLQEELDAMRAAASAARDADVLRQQAAALPAGLAREHLLKEVARSRRAAAAPLVQLNRELRGGQALQELQDELLTAIQKQRRKRPFRRQFTSWSRQQIEPLIKKLFRRAKGELTDLTQLHRLRVAAKRLKYALELVGESLKKSLARRAYRQLDRLQTELGDINDTRNLIGEIERALTTAKRGTLRAQLRRLLVNQRRRLTIAQEAWHNDWENKRARRLKRLLRRLAE